MILYRTFVHLITATIYIYLGVDRSETLINRPLHRSADPENQHALAMLTTFRLSFMHPAARLYPSYTTTRDTQPSIAIVLITSADNPVPAQFTENEVRIASQQ